MVKLKLTLNESKTCIRNAHWESFDFLGYTFGPACYRQTGGRYQAARPSARSVQRLKQKLHAVFHRGHVAPWPEAAAQANRLLRGWATYFGYGTRKKAYRAIDNYVYDRVVRFLKQRHKVSSRGTQKFPGPQVFEGLGLQRLRSWAYAHRPCALT